MKKILLSTVALLSVMFAIGQQTTQPEQPKAAKSTSTDGILPVKGDIGLTIGATTSLNYLGNFFGKNVANANSAMFDYSVKGLPTAVIAGKYFLQDDKAVRVGVCIYQASTSKNFMIHDDTKLDPDAYVFDKAKFSNSGYCLSLGLEKRRGYKRLQGIFAGEVFMGNIGANNFKYEYGNKFSEVNQAPTSSAFPKTSGSPVPSWGYRLVSEHTSSVYSVGARAVIGMEYFFASKMSIGGEFFWGLQYQNTSKESSTYEYYNSVLKEINSQTIESKNNKAFNVGPSNLGGNLNLNFYF
jgi:hypothetical protein